MILIHLLSALFVQGGEEYDLPIIISKIFPGGAGMHRCCSCWSLSIVVIEMATNSWFVLIEWRCGVIVCDL